MGELKLTRDKARTVLIDHLQKQAKDIYADMTSGHLPYAKESQDSAERAARQRRSADGVAP